MLIIGRMPRRGCIPAGEVRAIFGHRNTIHLDEGFGAAVTRPSMHPENFPH
ncbi:hypothetical protein [Rhodanobacter koreensis]